MIVTIRHPSPIMPVYGPFRDVTDVQCGPSMSLPDTDARRHQLTFRDKRVLQFDVPNTKYVCCVVEERR